MNELTSLFPLALFNMLFIIGLNRTTEEGMIFEKLGTYCDSVLGSFWNKPVVGCPPCMASLHGTYFFAIFSGLSLMYLPFYVLALSGLTYIVNSKI